MNFEDKLILALLREAKKDEDDPDVENIFGVPMRKVPKPTQEQLKKWKEKWKVNRRGGDNPTEEDEFYGSLRGKKKPKTEDPNEVDETNLLER